MPWTVTDTFEHIFFTFSFFPLFRFVQQIQLTYIGFSVPD